MDVLKSSDKGKTSKGSASRPADQPLPEESRKLIERIITEGVVPHAETITGIWSGGAVAFVVFEVPLELHEGPLAIGWDGTSPVFELAPVVARRLAKNLGRIQDHATKRWLERRGPGRVFLFAQQGTLVLNYTEGEGWSLEPGTTDYDFEGYLARRSKFSVVKPPPSHPVSPRKTRPPA